MYPHQGIALAAASLLAGMVALSPAAAKAQILKRQILYGPSFGAALPFGDLDKWSGTGQSYGVAVDFVVADGIAVGGELVYTQFNSMTYRIPDADLPMLGMKVTYFQNTYAPNSLALIGGLGFYGMKGLTPSGYSGSWKVSPGISVGAGVIIRVDKGLKSSLTGRIQNVFTENKSTRFFTITAALLFQSGPSE
jgi:hypothetical protein